MVDFFKKQIGLKVALFTTLCTLFFVGVVLLVLAQLHLSVVTRANFVGLFVLFSLFMIFFQAVLVALAVNVFVVRPVQGLQRTMQSMEEGQSILPSVMESPDELGELGSNFHRMVKSLKHINENKKNIEQKLIKAEESLKYKIALEEKASIIERMNRELTDAFRDVSLLYTVSQYLSSVLEIRELADTVQKIFVEKFKCDRFALYFIPHSNLRFKLHASKGLGQDEQGEQDVELGVGITGLTAQKKRAFYINDLTRYPHDQLMRCERDGAGSVFSLPLMVRDKLIGVLWIGRAEANSFTPTDRQSLESIASQIAIAFDRSQLYTKTKELSVRDELTGIYNRRHFYHMLGLEFKRAERFKRYISLLMFDVDHFKKFNDTYGHLKGDEILRQFAQLLQANIREVDVLARFGGEEFVIMLTDTSLGDAVSVANKLRELIRTQLRLEDVHTHPMTVSIGVSSYPDSAIDKDDLINTADVALYAAKHDGRDCIRCYQVDHLPLEDMMEEALPLSSHIRAVN